MNMPGFTAHLSLGPTIGIYRGNVASSSFSSDDDGQVVPQFRFSIQSDPDLGAYLRCKANGGDESICRFFGGLPPFVIGRYII